MALITRLQSVASLDEFAKLVESKEWSAHLASMAEASDPDEVEALRRAVADVRDRLSPEHTCPELQALKEQVYAGGSAEALRPLLSRIAALRTELPTRYHERLFARAEGQLGQMFSPGLGGTGYSNRARRARDLFTEHAGRTKIEGAKTDTHGNAAGTAYDLGRDGAFTGHAVHVLHLYHGEGFDFKQPAEALERKGFRVERRTKPGTPADLARWLEDAQQLWLISSSRRTLEDEHIEVIRAFWRRGGGLYIWGDNKPYYIDANAVLGRLLLDSDLALDGDLRGGKVVREVSATGRRGFLPHLITTGLEHLFEGITVASLDEAVAARNGFVPLLYGSAGNLITVVREPSPAGGAALIDGAFTRLYCQWDEAGSARYVSNAACFLAAMTLPEDEEEPSAAAEPEALAYEPAGAFRGVCDLTGAAPKTWLVLSVRQLADALRNTSDGVLNDPLGFGEVNCVFSDHLYDERLGEWIVANGADPLTKEAVAACLPLVDLAHEGNRREFTQVLCRCLMGGKYLPAAARLVFFAVIDQMLDPARKTKHREVWAYLRRQSLAHFTSTPEFAEMGKHLPLLDAMAAYFSPATPQLVQLRKSFATVGVIGRTLLREDRATPEQVRTIGRRALVKALVGDAVAAEKARPDSVKPAVEAMLYANTHGIPTFDGGRVTADWPAFARDVSGARQRLERTLETGLLSPEEQTVVLHEILALDLRQFTAEDAVAWLLLESKPVSAVWEGEPAGDVVAALNERFAAYHGAPIDPAETHLKQSPPFATTYGPSVYACVCGERFGDPADPVNDETIQALADARRRHFRDVYRGRAEGWYPGEGTLHYNLHRAVQRVVAEQFTEAKEFDELMVGAVAGYLHDDAKGFVCDPQLERHIRTALMSYLALRKAGQPHPEGVLTLRVKAERERRLAHGVTSWRQPK